MRKDNIKMNKGGFSWKRATGITRAKQSISRTTGIPLTKSGRQRKIGKAATGGCCLLNALLIITLITLIIILSFSLISCGQSVTTTTIAQTTTTRVITTTSVISDGSVKYGLSENQRKQAFYDLVVLQDSIAAEDPPDRSDQMLEAYSVIAKKYGITKDEMMKIGVEGMEKNWPFPPIK